ncbi:MAG: 2'-5' RNA ligase family protein [Rhizomicrobium sp.]
MAGRAPRRKFGPTQKDRIFLAVLPDAETAARIHALAAELKREHSLDGTQILPEHLHVTLFHLGDWNGLPEPIVAATRKAADQAVAAPFDVAFDRAGSFRNRSGIHPFVLTGREGDRPWRSLYAALGDTLKQNGLASIVHGAFTPHVTLLRDGRSVKPAPAGPIGWTVREFVLIHSLLGKTTHIHLARWPLRPL